MTKGVLTTLLRLDGGTLLIELPPFDPPFPALFHEHRAYLRGEDGYYREIECWEHPTRYEQPMTIHMFVDDYTTLCGIYDRGHPWGGGSMTWRDVTCVECRAKKGTAEDPGDEVVL